MLGNSKFEERRDSIRARRIITVRHRLVERKGKKNDALWQLSTTEDMSLSGVLFTSAVAYQQDDIVELQIVMSGVLDIFNGYAQVVRSIKHKAGHFKVAVKYVNVKIKNRPAKSLLRLK